MNIIIIIFLSIVQGITEWLPISSSGHLVLFEHLLKFSESSLSFDVFLHLASLVVIVLFFKAEIKEILVLGFKKKSKDPRHDWFWLMVLSSIVTAVFGLIFYQNIEFFRTIDAVSGWLMVTSILLLATKFTKGHKSIRWPHAIALGMAQGFAVLPGLSRSGAVIAIALAMKIRKKDAFDYAFILAIPAILASFLLTFNDLVFNWWYLLGFAITVLVGYYSLVLLKIILKKDYFYLFFIYTLVLSLLIKLI